MCIAPSVENAAAEDNVDEESLGFRAPEASMSAISGGKAPQEEEEDEEDDEGLAVTNSVKYITISASVAPVCTGLGVEDTAAEDDIDKEAPEEEDQEEDVENEGRRRRASSRSCWWPG